MKKLILLISLTLVLTGCEVRNPETGQVMFDESVRTQTTEFKQYNLVDGQEIAIFDTTLGEIKIALFTNEAPNTVTHFKKLITNGFYTDKGIFLEGDFELMLTGAIKDDIDIGEIATPDGKKVSPEIITDVWHFEGAVSTWGQSESRLDNNIYSDSRFFIVGDIPYDEEILSQMDSLGYPLDVMEMYKEKGGLPQYTNKYTVFGQVYEGLDVVKEITSLVDGSSIRMIEDIRINSASIDVYQENEN